jgi:hypothetical protein
MTPRQSLWLTASIDADRKRTADADRRRFGKHDDDVDVLDAKATVTRPSRFGRLFHSPLHRGASRHIVAG